MEKRNKKTKQKQNCVLFQKEMKPYHVDDWLQNNKYCSNQPVDTFEKLRVRWFDVSARWCIYKHIHTISKVSPVSKLRHSSFFTYTLALYTQTGSSTTARDRRPCLLDAMKFYHDPTRQHNVHPRFYLLLSYLTSSPSAHPRMYISQVLLVGKIHSDLRVGFSPGVPSKDCPPI